MYIAKVNFNAGLGLAYSAGAEVSVDPETVERLLREGLIEEKPGDGAGIDARQTEFPEEALAPAEEIPEVVEPALEEKPQTFEDAFPKKRGRKPKGH